MSTYRALETGGGRIDGGRWEAVRETMQRAAQRGREAMSGVMDAGRGQTARAERDPLWARPGDCRDPEDFGFRDRGRRSRLSEICSATKIVRGACIAVAAVVVAVLLTLLANVGRARYRGPVIGSPTTPHELYVEQGCPALGDAPARKRLIQIHNNCSESIWPGVTPAGAAQAPPEGWEWKPGECRTLMVASDVFALRVWARTRCDSKHRCLTGSCLTDPSGACVGAGEAPVSLWEATFQDHCTVSPTPGLGADFHDCSLVDGFNLPLQAHTSGGWNVGQVHKNYSCGHPAIRAFNLSACPFELSVYSDQLPGTNMPLAGWNGVDTETSPCYKTPLDPLCRAKVVGCRSLCKAVEQGWIGYYIDNVQGDPDLVDPLITTPTGVKLRWSQQFLQGKDKCGPEMCRDSKAWGAYRGSAYAGGGSMKNLVCCDFGFRCSPYQPNSIPWGCPYGNACPTLGAADPASRFYGKVEDVQYPQVNEAIRKSSSFPDWPMPTVGWNYAEIFKRSSPTSYSWQFNDASSTYNCCGTEGKAGPSYVLTFCGHEEHVTTKNSTAKSVRQSTR